VTFGGEMDALEVKDRLTEFFAKNSKSVLVEREVSDGTDKEFLIENPWDDRTVAIFLPIAASLDEFENLVAALNKVVLPSRFSAVLHTENKELEVIWTAYKLKAPSSEVVNRTFDFQFEGRSHKCRFGEATPQLRLIAKHCAPVSVPTSTEHRNILSLHLLENGFDRPNLDKAISFFISLNDLEESNLVDFVHHLNAYMVYFDHRTPKVLIHDNLVIGEMPIRDRYISGEFPRNISASRIEPILLAYWNEMGMTRNEIMRFLLCYRIIEYAAFNFVEGATKIKIKRLLMSPDLLDNLDLVVSRVAEITNMSKEASEIPRAQSLVSATVNLDCVWKEIERDKDFFSQQTCFDGGFSVTALISNKEVFENWEKNGVRNTLDRLRQIRNALSHGQDGQTRGTILPNRANAILLRPWLNLIEIIAGDAILYREVA
jgi:hypothetical protein